MCENFSRFPFPSPPLILVLFCGYALVVRSCLETLLPSSVAALASTPQDYWISSLVYLEAKNLPFAWRLENSWEKKWINQLVQQGAYEKKLGKSCLQQLLTAAKLLPRATRQPMSSPVILQSSLSVFLGLCSCSRVQPSSSRLFFPLFASNSWKFPQHIDPRQAFPSNCSLAFLYRKRYQCVGNILLVPRLIGCWTSCSCCWFDREMLFFLQGLTFQQFLGIKDCQTLLEVANH